MFNNFYFKLCFDPYPNVFREIRFGILISFMFSCGLQLSKHLFLDH